MRTQVKISNSYVEYTEGDDDSAVQMLHRFFAVMKRVHNEKEIKGKYIWALGVDSATAHLEEEHPGWKVTGIAAG